MIDHEATIRPTFPETVMMLTITMLLIINLVATIHAANYEPECIPAIVTTEEAE
jgi:hypothetical protein